MDAEQIAILLVVVLVLTVVASLALWVLELVASSVMAVWEPVWRLVSRPTLLMDKQ